MSFATHASPALSPVLLAALQRGRQHQILGEWEAAASAYRKVLNKVPDHVVAIHLLAMVRGNQGKIDEAIRLYRSAAERNPADPKIWFNWGLLLGSLERYAEAAEIMAKSTELPDAHADAFSMLAYYRRAIADWRGYEHLMRMAAASCAPGLPSPLPLHALWMDDPGLQRIAAENQVARQGFALGTTRPSARSAGSRLRIGYLGADFRNHPSARLIAPIFEQHDRSEFEVFAFSIGANDHSGERARIEAAIEHFHDMANLPSTEIVSRIKAYEVDILVDLMGHTSGARHDLLAARTSPIQVSMLGFPGTTGAQYLDYLIADEIVAPLSDEGYFREKLVHLPDTYFPNDLIYTLGQCPRRDEVGLPSDSIVFGSFNLVAKITPEMFDSWMRILHQVPDSVLWMMAAQDAQENLRTEARSRGVDPARLVFAPRTAPEAHMARLALVDVALDTFPYTGHTTTSDMIRAGVPVVTHKGRAFAARVAASLLGSCGLEELIADDQASYEALGVRLAQDSAYRRFIRDQVARGRDDGPLFQPGRYARHLESAYRLMNAKLTAGNPPAHISVPPISLP